MRRIHASLFALAVLGATIGAASVAPPARAVGPAASVVVTTSVNPATAGQAVTVRAKVADPATPSSGITGSIAFRDGMTPLSTVAVTSGVGSCSNRSLGAGSHTLTATFTSVTAGTPVVSTPLTQTVVPAATTTTVTSTRPTANYGQCGNIYTTVRAVAPGAGIPTGTVDFSIDSGWFLNAPLDTTGKAQLPLSYIYPAYTPGTYTITATYNGDANYNPSASMSGVAQTLVGISTTPVATVAIGTKGQLTFAPTSFTLSSANPVGCNVTITNTTSGAITLIYGTPGWWKRMPCGVIAAGASGGVGVGMSNFTGYLSAMGASDYVAIHCN